MSDIRQNPAKLSKMISNFVNSHSSLRSHREEFADAVVSQHRTLQQSTFRLFLCCIKKWSEQEVYDARNEYTINKCKEIMELIDYEPPFI